MSLPPCCVLSTKLQFTTAFLLFLAGFIHLQCSKSCEVCRKALSTTAGIFWWWTEQEGRWPVKKPLSTAFWNASIFAWGGIISQLPKFKNSSEWFEVRVGLFCCSASSEAEDCCFRVWSKPTKLCRSLSDASRLGSWLAISAQSPVPCGSYLH